jgi:hypothetical protein
MVRACRGAVGPFQVRRRSAPSTPARRPRRHRLAPDRPAYDQLIVVGPPRRRQQSRRRGEVTAPTPGWRPSTADLDAYPPFHISRAELLVRADGRTTPSSPTTGP